MNSFHLLAYWHLFIIQLYHLFCFPLQIVLPPHLDNVRDKLAENIHELWGMNKIELGWTYGKVKPLCIITFSRQNGCRSAWMGTQGHLRSFTAKSMGH